MLFRSYLKVRLDVTASSKHTGDFLPQRQHLEVKVKDNVIFLKGRPLPPGGGRSLQAGDPQPAVESIFLFFYENRVHQAEGTTGAKAGASLAGMEEAK